MLKREQSSYQLSDEDLILQYKSTCDNYYVGQLFERYANIIYGISLKYLKDKHAAEDNMAEIFEKLLSKLLTKEVGKFRNWLFVMVKNHCVSKLRSSQTQDKRKQKYKEYVSQLFIADLNADVSIAEQDEFYVEQEMLHEFIESLPSMQKICISYFYFENKSYMQIAEILGESVGKIRSFIQNGRRNLKNKISKIK